MKKIKLINRQILLILIVVVCISNLTTAQVFKNLQGKTISLSIGNKDIFSDNRNGSNKPFIAVFRDTLIGYTEINEKYIGLDSVNKREKIIRDIGIDFVEKEMRLIIDKNAINVANTNSDTIWTMDTVIAGRRCYAIGYSWSPSRLSDDCFPGNIIYLNFPEEIQKSRSFLGILFYKSEDAGFIFNLKAP